MKLERQVEELAKIEGWVYNEEHDVWVRADGVTGHDGRAHRDELDSYNSHDALQRIIDRMDSLRLVEYFLSLCDVMGVSTEADTEEWTVRATTEQKAEAILKAYGTWEES